MSRRVLSVGMVIGGTASLARVCEFVAFTFIGILKSDDTAKPIAFQPPLPFPTWAPSTISLEFFQIKRLVFGIAFEASVDRVTRITHSNFADQKICAEIDQCGHSQCGHS